MELAEQEDEQQAADNLDNPDETRETARDGHIWRRS
jgi:hypothetical protein